MRRDPERNGRGHGASAGNRREARHSAVGGKMPCSDNPYRNPALVTCEQVGNVGYPKTGLTAILKPAGVLLGRRYPEAYIPVPRYEETSVPGHNVDAMVLLELDPWEHGHPGPFLSKRDACAPRETMQECLSRY